MHTGINLPGGVTVTVTVCETVTTSVTVSVTVDTSIIIQGEKVST